ncbi:hypothetical protein OC846_005301 [Tilletia horrida]|uniref:Tetraspanin Tsp2 n=1 Tax=Tilletia horrida TaxID=155126 RepID=A0AAN6JQ20_9BASI|nr:hypothetical protein OC845_005537 [Tilletia horrida]KAK0546368.1 hypothetical protein OC846_005301 [Tilletia horrida]KAK0562103.1 hypothetical protein OC861_005490 [Tilletia horrida]
MPPSSRQPASAQQLQQQQQQQQQRAPRNTSSSANNSRDDSASSDADQYFPPPPPIPQSGSYSRPASRASMAETFRTATPHSFDQRRPSITPNLSQQQRAASPLIFDDQHQNHIRTASPSLALNYVPGKFSTRVFQPDRSHSPAAGGLFASRSTSRLRPLPTSGSNSHLSPPYAIALGHSSRSNSGNNTDVDEEEEEEQEAEEQERLGAITPFTTAVRQAAASNPAQAPRLRHSIKRGAGRSAWGPDGAGNRALGAGDYEDDDGVDLSRTASQRLGLRRRHSANRKGAVGGSTSSHRSRRIVEAPGEADRRRTSMLHSNLGHFEEIEDDVDDNSDLDSEIDEHGLRPSQANGQGASNVGKSMHGKQKRTRSMRRDPNDAPLPSSSAQQNAGGGWASGRMGYLLGFHDGDDDRTQLGHGRPSEYGHGDETMGLRQQNQPQSAQHSRMDSAGRPRPKRRRRARWNPFKWAMVIANLVLTVYAMAALFATLLTWANIFENAATVRVGNRTELICEYLAPSIFVLDLTEATLDFDDIVGTVAAGLCFAAAVIGWCGILLNNRAFLSIYTIVLWIAFIFIMAPGYITFKRRTFNLEGKINQQWSRRLSVSDRLVIQDELNCCGYYSPFVLASASGRCYARSMLPGCKGRYLRFQRTALEYFYICAFGIVGPHLLIITVALLCSNHVTYRFGKGLTPEEYRLDEVTTELIKDQLLKTQREQNLPQQTFSPGLSEKSGFQNSDSLRPPAVQYREASYDPSSGKSGRGTDEAGSSTLAHHEQANAAHIDMLAKDDHSRASGSGNGSADGSGRRHGGTGRRGEEHELQEMNVRGGSNTTYNTAGGRSEEEEGPVFYAQ